jgi:hypothetical protein
VVSFGSMGLVYSLTLEVLDEYWLRERNEAVPWNDVKNLLRLESVGGIHYPVPRVLAESDFWEFLVNCAEVQGKNRTKNPMCFVRTRNRCAEIARPDNWKDKHAWPPRRADVSCLQKIAEDVVRPELFNSSGKTLGIVDIGKSIRNNFENSADKPPFEGDLDRSRNYWVLRRERDDTKPQEEPERPPQAISNEIAVPLERTIEAVDRILDIMSSNAYFYAVPFGVRFVAPSEHYLAMQYDRPTCMIEIPMLLPNDAGKRAAQMREYKNALEAIEDALCHDRGNLGGRPHWGQYNGLNRTQLESLYEKLPEFERAYSEHNAFGTFDNDYTRQIGLRRTVVEADEEETNWTPLRIATDHAL